VLRREACAGFEAESEIAPEMLWRLAERGGSFAAIDAPDLERCKFAERSPIPAADGSRSGNGRLRALRDTAAAQFVNGDTGRAAATAVCAGVLLVNDLLDASHDNSQSIEGDVNGDYWHGLMHRREPDSGNAKYWFRRVGDHPAFAMLADVARGIASGNDSSDVASWVSKLTDGDWDAFAAVDLSEIAHRNPSTDLHTFAERLLWAEMILLLAHCCRAAG
jgi:hypothetical protein